jgi:hypothetical protein
MVYKKLYQTENKQRRVSGRGGHYSPTNKGNDNESNERRMSNNGKSPMTNRRALPYLNQTSTQAFKMNQPQT